MTNPVSYSTKRIPGLTLPGYPENERLVRLENIIQRERESKLKVSIGCLPSEFRVPHRREEIISESEKMEDTRRT